jgi:hypothetical protein
MAARRPGLRTPLVALLGVGLLGLTGFALLPSLDTGYWGEDTYYSTIVTGGLVINGHTWMGELLEYEKHNIQLGRFYPLTPVIISSVFSTIRDVVLYKAYLIVVTALDVFLFFLMARKLGGAKGFAGLAGCLAIGLFQFRIYIDPILGYYGQIQWMTAGIFVSLLALQLFLEGRGRRWLVASVAAYLAASLIYEVAYTLVVLHLGLILANGGDWRARVVRSLPFLAVVGSCGMMSFLVRRLYPDHMYLQHPKLDPKVVLLAMAQQTSSALPLNYYWNDPLSIFRDSHAFTSAWVWTAGPRVALVSLFALVLSYASLRSGSKVAGERPVRWRPMVGTGLALAILPATLIAISPYHQNYLTFGVGWIPVMTQYFGVALLLASGIWGAVGLEGGGGAFARGKCLAASGLVACLVGLTFRANVEVARCFNAPPGSGRFREFAGSHGASWHLPRINLEAALDAGLMDEVPARSTVQLANSYPYWHDAAWAPFFYAKHTNKALTLTLTTATPTSVWTFKVRDLFEDRRTGFVVLSEVVADGSMSAGRALRLFVRCPGLGRDGAPLGISTAGPETLPLGHLPLLRSGRDWALYSLEPLGSKVNPDSLRVVDEATGTAWAGYGRDRAIATRGDETTAR